MSEVGPEFLEIFREEANERLDAMVATLLAVEAGRAPNDAVDSLLRDAHTIKGSAGMVGLDTVVALAHAVEEVLVGARESGALDRAHVDSLLAATDTLRGEATGTADEDVATAIARLGTPSPAQTASDPAEEPRGEPARGEKRTIRVPAEKVDRLLDVVGETFMNRRRLEHVVGPDHVGDGRALADELDLGERLLNELKDAAIQMRTLPLSSITGPYARAVRDVARAQGKRAELVVTGAETELDRVILESLSEPLVHVLRNAVAHGIEPPDEREAAGKDPVGRVELRALQRGGTVEVAVADDGRGVAAEVLAEARRVGSLVDVLTRAGFSTSAEVSEFSGRGVGLDAVKRHAESFGGSLEVRSRPGEGTEIVLTLPLALALADVLLVERGGQPFGIPLGAVEEVTAMGATLLLSGQRSLELRGRPVPFADLADVLHAEAAPLPESAAAVVVSSAGRRLAVACDRLLGEDEVVVKPLGPLFADVSTYLGAAILGDGRIALLLEPAVLLRSPVRRSMPRETRHADPAKPTAAKVLVVEDSFMVRELQRSILEAAGYRVDTAEDGRDALAQLLADHEIALVLTDVQMPEMDGLELTRAIRATPTCASTPVVILTSLADEEQQRQGLEAGADAYMVKRSFDQGVLLETVHRLLGA